MTKDVRKRKARSFNDLTGQQFGKWSVIRHLGTNKQYDRMYECRCQCGIVKSVKAMSLLAGTSSQCVKCGQCPKSYPDGVPDAVWNHLLKMAARREIGVTISKEEAFALLEKQNKRCALSGVEIALPANGTEMEYRTFTASLDRIDSDGIYSIDNVQWVHKQINIMKNVFSQESFVKMCCRVAEQKR